MKNTSPFITFGLLSLLACTVLATGTQQEASASNGGNALVINGNNNTIDLSPQELKKLTRDSSKILALLTTFSAKQERPSEKENHLAQEN